MSESTVRQAYEDFLTGYAGLHSRYGKRYYMLSAVLAKVPFVSVFANDENRAEDGKRLRLFFAKQYKAEEEGRVLDILSGTCSLLEMMIGLAQRLDGMAYGVGDRVETTHWFFVLLENLGWTAFDDDAMIEEDAREELKIRIDILLERLYHPDGSGGFFPLKSPKKDQRKVEIWYQANAWMIENAHLHVDKL